MKRAIKQMFRMLGIEVSRYKQRTRTKRTNELSLYSTTTGKYYLPKDAHEDIVANTIISNKIFEEQIIDCARTYIQRDSCVLDVGANFGQMSILFASMVGPKGKVYSFDADDFVFDILKRNIAVNNINNIIAIFGAVHYLSGETLMFPEQDFENWGAYGSYGIDYNAKEGREVKSLTIDSLEIKERISFMKVDIQGGDLFALKGAVETIKKNRMPIIFEFEWNLQDEFKLDFQEYVDFVLSIGYRFSKVILGHNYLITPNI